MIFMSIPLKSHPSCINLGYSEQIIVVVKIILTVYWVLIMGQARLYKTIISFDPLTAILFHI